MRYPTECCLYEKKSYICKTIEPRWYMVKHFYESVFVLSEVGNVVVSRLRDGEQHSSLYSYVAVCVLHTYLILSKCGVSHRLLLLQVFPQPPT